MDKKVDEKTRGKTYETNAIQIGGPGFSMHMLGA